MGKTASGKSTGSMLSAAILAAVMAQRAAAAEDPSTTLAKCGEEKDDARRLACYERAIGEQAECPGSGRCGSANDRASAGCARIGCTRTGRACPGPAG
jgi:hypothetical protein